MARATSMRSQPAAETPEPGPPTAAPGAGEGYREVMMRRVWLAVLFSGAVLAIGPRIGHVQPPDVERTLVERFGFSTAEVTQLRGGQLVVKTLPAQGPEIAVLGAVRIADDKERLVRWIRDVEGLRKAAELGLSRKLSSPPTINDFGELALDTAELAVLQKCRPGDCALRLGDRAIARFRAEVDWAAADASRRANLLTRQLMLGYAEAYLKGGDEALGAAHNEKKPRLVAEEFRTLIRNATNLYALASPLASYLEQFPKAQIPGVEGFLYWATGGGRAGAGDHAPPPRDPSGPGRRHLRGEQAALREPLCRRRAPRPVAGHPTRRQGLLPARSRSTMLEGLPARLLRGRVEEESRSYTQIYLDWIRRSLAPA